MENRARKFLPLHGFRKITPVNGFDAANPDNAMQNNDTGSMAEMDGYLYVGTTRNIAYSMLNYQIPAYIPVPPVLAPSNVDMAGEIWRYKLDGSAKWERVYKAPPEPVNIGFSHMIHYQEALYAGALTPFTPELLILKSTDGVHWQPLSSGIPGYSVRSIIIHQEKLFMGVQPVIGGEASLLFVSDDPEISGWHQVNVDGDPDKNPRGNIDLLFSFNNRLYVATALPTGFELWRTNGPWPQRDDWVLVVDQGAGDARNEHLWSVDVFHDRIYIGTALEIAIKSMSPDEPMVSPKGFDLIRVDADDHWELIVGGPPVVPTNPVTGSRGLPLSGFTSGFGDITNGYCWQLQTFGDELFLGTWNWNDLIPAFLSVISDYLEPLYPSPIWDVLRDILLKLVLEIYRLGRAYLGFDLWKSQDGVDWFPVSLNGLNNPFNYGVRQLFVSSDQRLFLGTANPFQGCEVWVKRLAQYVKRSAGQP